MTSASELVITLGSRCAEMMEVFGEDEYRRGVDLAQAALTEEMDRLAETNPFGAVLRLKDEGLKPEVLVWMACAATERLGGGVLKGDARWQT